MPATVANSALIHDRAADSHQELLLEIGAEELPASHLEALAEDLANAVEAALQQARIPATGGRYVYATPRRIALRLLAVPLAQPDQHYERRGPTLRVAVDAHGELTTAGRRFAESLGVASEQLERRGDGADARLCYRHLQPGERTQTLLPRLINQALGKLCGYKRMRWGRSTFEFARPVHWVVLLFGDEPIETTVLGVRSGATTFGHRFHAPAAIILGHPSEYPARLAAAYVIAAPDARRQRIREQVRQAALVLGAKPPLAAQLIADNAALCEWPVAVTGDFERRFLKLPKAVIATTLITHQRYFPLETAGGELLPHFIAISNIESRDPLAVRHGNERVVRPRLEDAAFFYRSDTAKPLAHYLPMLDRIVFQQQLGSVGDKARRISALAATIACQMHADANTVALAERAGLLCKCDLATRTVGEFPELQGIIGGEYARLSGEHDTVASAIAETYRPRFAGDKIPTSVLGQALALADKLDTLAGIFSIGLAPHATKDPFALRRAAIGVLRILIEADCDLDLLILLEAAIAKVASDEQSAAKQQTLLMDFMTERLRAYVIDQMHIPAEIFAAAYAAKNARCPNDFIHRLRAIENFCQLPAAKPLVAANKRIINILRQQPPAPPDAAMTTNPALFKSTAESQLHDHLNRITANTKALLSGGDYQGALLQLATLRESVDTFFDNVKVIDEDARIRANRIALISHIQRLFSEIADISQLSGRVT